MSNFEQILDGVADLPLDQQKLFIEIVKHCTTAARRQEWRKPLKKR